MLSDIQPGSIYTAAVLMPASQPYLMKPGGAILPLPAMWPGSTFDPNRGESVTVLSSGGTAVFKNLDAKRSFSLVYTQQPDPGSNVLDILYRGLLDDPVTAYWVFVDPTVYNVLSLDAGAPAGRSQAAIAWTASSGSLAANTTVPDAVLGGGVLSWSGMSTGASVTVGTSASSVDPTKGHPYLGTEPVTASVYLQCASSVSVTVGLQGYTAAGAVISGASQTVSASVGSSWSRASVSIPAGLSKFASAVFVRPVVTVSSALGSPLLLSAAQLEYAAGVSSWQPGQGSPRVVITSGIGRAVQIPGYSDHTLTMAEV